jgi:WhiB family redox-sensing transcriptional regulator
MPREDTPARRKRSPAPWTKPRYDKDTWRRAAACGDEDPDLFFPVGSNGPAARQTKRAKAVCATCTVRSPCLMFALTSNQEFGVWGGCDEDERRLLRRRWRAAAAKGASPPSWASGGSEGSGGTDDCDDLDDSEGSEGFGAYEALETA